MNLLRNLLAALLNTILGVFFGILLLEAILQVNPRSLPRGMSVPIPIDAPLSERNYEVHYTDGDVFIWRPDLITSPVEDKLESEVTLATDQFGFRNSSPLPAYADVVVLGRSYSLGAQVNQPWPQLLAEEMQIEVVNLSQPSATMERRLQYLSAYGLPRQPNWVILEIMPHLDIFNFQPQPPWITSHLPVAILQGLFGSSFRASASDNPVYPLSLQIAGTKQDAVCCIHYVDTFSVNTETIAESSDWLAYQTALEELVQLTQENNSCVAILFAPQKSDIYFSIVDDPADLQPIADLWNPIELSPDGHFITNTSVPIEPQILTQNALATRDLLANYAADHNLLFIDPTPILQQNLIRQDTPYLVYDSHLNQSGHQLVAQTVAEALAGRECP